MVSQSVLFYTRYQGGKRGSDDDDDGPMFMELVDVSRGTECMGSDDSRDVSVQRDQSSLPAPYFKPLFLHVYPVAVKLFNLLSRDYQGTDQSRQQVQRLTF